MLDPRLKLALNAMELASVNGWVHDMSYLKHMPADSGHWRVDNSQMMQQSGTFL